jgi:hypothetical protein
VRIKTAPPFLGLADRKIVYDYGVVVQGHQLGGLVLPVAAKSEMEGRSAGQQAGKRKEGWESMRVV